VIPTFETCTKQGAGCTAPPYANLWTYQITPGNYGGSLRLHGDAFNAVGSYGSDSDPYEVLPEKPFNFTPPTISGTLQVGETLVANPGVWREPPYPATEPVGKGYQWLDCPTGGGACTAIPGAISSTLRLMPSDLGKDIEVVVTGSNRGGSTDVASAQTAVVGPARPSPDRPPTPAPAPPPGDRPTPPTPPSGGTRPVTPLPDMALTMTSNPPPGPIFGVSQITYSVTAANVSDVTAVDAVVTDVLPANLSFVSATVNRSPYACSATGQVVTCPFTSFAGRDSIRIDIVANVNSAVATTNTATVTELQSDANATNNSASVTHT
jgi:uncharacterized repeat protein (TIGR01451 family)